MARLGVYVADGFSDDCEELIHRCSKKKPLTYHTFCAIWKSMNFASMYQGRTTSAEIAELSEEVLLVAKRFMLAETDNFEETVAGLFLVYALLNLQPFPNFAALRITPEDVPVILYIEKTARKEKRYDALYILGVVLIRGPCQFHAAEREYGMEIAFRKNFEGIDDNSSSRPRGVFSHKSEELDILSELKSLTQRYEEIKAAITDDTGRMDPDLHYVKQKFPEEMEKTLKTVLTGLNEDDEDEQQPIEDRHIAVRDIKNRALKNTVNFMRHLTGVEQRVGTSTGVVAIKPMAKPKQSKTGEQNSPKKGGKIKTSSPKKPLITSATRKKNSFLRPKKLKRHNLEMSSSDSEEGDLVIPESDDNDNDDDDRSQADISDDGSQADLDEAHVRNAPMEINFIEIDTASQADINEASFDKDPKETRVLHTETAEADEATEKEIDIEIDTLPVLIRKCKDQNIEIEFIDNFNKNNTPSTSKVEVKKDLKKKCSELKDISLVKVTDSESEFKFKRPDRCYNSRAKLKFVNDLE